MRQEDSIQPRSGARCRRRFGSRTATLGATVLAVLFAPPAAAAPGFLPIPPLDSATYDSRVTDLSDDGLVTVGWSDSDEGVRATRWTESAGPVSLGSQFMIQPGDRYSEATAVSGDGATVVGWSRVDSSGAQQFPDRRIAFQWTEAGGFGVYPLSSGVEAWAVDVSADGATVVGVQRSSVIASFAVRFNDTGSPAPVGFGCCSTFLGGTAAAVSADGSRILGGSFYLTYGGARLSFLTGDSPPLSLIGTTASGDTVFAEAMTPDGSVVIGHKTDGPIPHDRNIFTWTEAGGFTDHGVYAPGLNTRTGECCFVGSK